MHKFHFKKYLLVLAVVGLLIFLHLFKVLSPIETVLNNLFSSTLSGLYSTGSTLRQTYDNRASKEALMNRINELEIKNKNLVIEEIKLKSLEEENRLLRQNLKFQADSENKYISANVISRSNQLDLSAQNQHLIINRGIEDGIEVGQIVISIYDNIGVQGVVVGKVAQTKKNTSEIFLLTNPNCELAVALWSDDKTMGITKGKLGLTIEIDYIPQNKEIKIGDIVTTSGLEQKIPKDLVVGEITEIIKENNELWQKASVSPLVDLDNLTILSVLVQ